jgi:signal peptidase I
MQQTIDYLPTTLAVKPRNAFIAFLLSLLLPGLGQVYNGQPKKAIILFSLLLLSPTIFGLTRGATSFYGLASVLAIEIALRIYSIADAVYFAKRQKDYELQPYNTWYYHLIIAIGMLAVLIIFDVRTMMGIAVYKVPTISSNPTFEVGDRIVVDMKAYKNSAPNYGHYVTFSRSDGELYNFRVVGRPNDKLDLIDNIVSINGKASKATFIKETTCDEMPVQEFEEQLPNGHKHLMYKFKVPYDEAKATIRNIEVPPDCYYLLGDNRDNAMDSRYVGFVHKDSIKGRVMYSFWGQTGTKRMNIDFTDK